MNETSAIQARLIGAIFVERGLVTESELETALRRQEETGERLGEILVGEFGVSRLELASVLAEQWAALEQASGADDATTRPSGAPGEVEPSASPVPVGDDDDAEETMRKTLGEIFVARGHIDAAELERALAAQRESGKRLGEVLVEQGSISRLDLAGALAEQWAGLQKLRPPAPRERPEPWQERAIASEHVATPEVHPIDEAAVEEVSELRSALAVLEERLRSAESDGASSAWRDELAATAGALASRIEGVEARLAELGSPAGIDAVEDLRASLSELRENAGEPVARLQELERRLEDLVAIQVEEAALDALRDRLSGLETRIAGLQPDAALTERLGAVEGQAEAAQTGLAAIAARLDEIAGRVPSQERLDEIGSAIADLAARERREEDDVLAALTARVEGLAASSADAGRLEELRREVQRVGELAQDVQAMQSRVGALSATVEGLAGAPPDTRVADELDALKETVLGLEQRAETAAASLAAVERLGETIEGILGSIVPSEAHESLVSRVRDLEGAAGPDPELTARVEALAQRVDALGDAGGGELADLRASLEALAAAPAGVAPERVDELERQLADARRELGGRLQETAATEREARAEIGVRLDTVHERLSRLDDLESRLERLREESRLAGAEAALDEVAQLRSLQQELTAKLADAPSRAELANAVTSLQAELGNVSSVLHDVVTESRGTAASVDARLGDLVTRPEVVGLAGDVSARVNSVEARLEELLERDDRDALARRLDEVRAGLESDAVARAEELEARLADLVRRDDLEGLARQLEEMVARGDLDGLARRLDELGERLSAEAEARASGVEARLADLPGRDDLDGLARRLDEVRAELEAESAARVAGVEARLDLMLTRDDFDALAERIADVRERLSGGAQEAVARLEERLGELTPRADLEGLARRLDETGERLSAEAHARVADLEPRLAGLASGADLEQVRRELEALRDSVSELDATERVGRIEERLGSTAATSALDELARRFESARGELESRLDGWERRQVEIDAAADAIASLRAAAAGEADARERGLADLATRIGEAEGALEDVATRVRSIDLAQHRADVEFRLEAVEAAARSAHASIENQVAAVTERLGREIEEMRTRIAGEQDRLSGVGVDLTARIDDVAVRVAAEVADVARELRDEIDLASSRALETQAAVDDASTALRAEIEQMASAAGWRLARLEEAVAAGGDRGALAERLDDLERALEAQAAQADEQAKAVEHAVESGLRQLAARIDEAGGAYLDATESFRRSLESLGSVVSEAGRLVGHSATPEPAVTAGEKRRKQAKKAKKPKRQERAASAGEPSADVGVPMPSGSSTSHPDDVEATKTTDSSHVAFVPTVDGYRLVEVEGPAPAAGGRVDDAEGGSLTVTRVGRSPLPFDTRACAYLERA